MDDSIVEAIAKSQQFSSLPSGRTSLAKNGECRSFENSRTS